MIEGLQLISRPKKINDIASIMSFIPSGDWLKQPMQATQSASDQRNPARPAPGHGKASKQLKKALKRIIQKQG